MALTDNTVAFYKLDDGAGATVVDATGRGNSLTPNTFPAVDTVSYFSFFRNANDGSQPLTGALRSWGGFGTAPTTAERNTLYNSGTSALSWAGLSSTLQAKARWWYDFDGIGAGYANDKTGNGSNLTVTGGAFATAVTGPGGVGSATHGNGAGQAYCVNNSFVQFGNRYIYVCGWVNVGNPAGATVQAMLSKWQGNSSATCPEFVAYIHSAAAVGQFWGDIGKGGDTQGPAHIANNVVVTHGTNLVANTWYFVEYEYDPSTDQWSLAVNRGTPAVVYPAAQPAPRTALVASTAGAGGFSSGSAGLASGGTQPGGIYDEAGLHYAAKASPGADLKFGSAAKTVWFWIKLASTATSQVPLGIYDVTGAVADWLIFYNSGSHELSLQISDGGGVNFAVAKVTLNDTNPHLVVAWYDKLGDNKVHINLDHGAATNASAALSFTPATVARDFRMGGATNGNQFEGTLDGVGIATGVPVQADLDYLWNTGSGREYPFSTSVNSTLAAATGTVTCSGQTAVLAPGLPGNFASFALTGRASVLAAGLAANMGSVAFSGQNTGLVVTLSGSQGNFALVGRAATLAKAVALSASTGHFICSGQAAALARAVVLSASTGAFSLSGQAAVLLASRRLIAGPGSILLTGPIAAFAVACPVAPGNFVAADQTAALAVVLLASRGAYALAGQDASLLLPGRLTADPGIFALSSPGSALLALRRFIATSGTFSFAGQAANLFKGLSVTLLGQSGSYFLQGQLARQWISWQASGGSYSLRGQTVTFVAPGAPPLAMSTVSLAVSLCRTVSLAAPICRLVQLKVQR